MELIRHAHNQKNSKDFHRHDKQIPFQDGSRGSADCCWVLLAEQPASSKYVNGGSEDDQRRKSEGGAGESVERLSLSEAPSEPARSEHGLNQRAAARANRSLRLSRQIQVLALYRCAAIQLELLRIKLKTP